MPEMRRQRCMGIVRFFIMGRRVTLLLINPDINVFLEVFIQRILRRFPKNINYFFQVLSFLKKLKQKRIALKIEGLKFMSCNRISRNDSFI